MCYRRIVEQSTQAFGKAQARSPSATDPRNRNPRSRPSHRIGSRWRRRTRFREMILDGTLEPGSRLRETDFSQRLGVARHTFRAATQILINEGLLRRSPNRGVQLTVLDADDIVDIFRLRAGARARGDPARRRRRPRSPAPQRAVERFNGARRRRLVADRSSTPTWTSTGRSSTPPTATRLSRAYAGVQSEILLCMAELRPHYDRPAEVAAEHRELLEAAPPRATPTGSRRCSADTSRKPTENLTKALKAREEATANERVSRSLRSARRARCSTAAGCRPSRSTSSWPTEPVAPPPTCPRGARPASNEAYELRDGGDRFGGFGVLGAVGDVNGEIADALRRHRRRPSATLDAALIELDGTANKGRLGANAMLGVSLAAARARRDALDAALRPSERATATRCRCPSST